MNKLTKVFYVLLTLFLLSCSSRTEKIESEMKAFVEREFPTAKHAIDRQGNTFKLTVSTDKSIPESELDQIMSSTLEEFYRSFYETSNEASTNTLLIVTIRSGTNSWTTREYDLFELGEIYQSKK